MDDDEVASTPTTTGGYSTTLRELAAAPGKRGDVLSPGERVAESYVVVRELDRGGMGIVYLVRDERLERDVALKLATAASAPALLRAQREARALAKLTHPNVVVVYDAGEYRGRLYVAMEYVSGGTARQWLATRYRRWREIVAIYAAAGDGLAAAHRAGIVHRDFKPDNVIVGDDGRARVVDFGLALAQGASSNREEDRLTAPGRAIGTPAYMAPEQLDGAVADARADQYAFCASVWEGLYGRPHDQPPREGHRVPAHVEQTLRRGLARESSSRWPEMTTLLVELRRDPGRTRRRVAGGLGAALAIAAGTALALPRATEDRCGTAEAQLQSMWGAARSSELRSALSDASQPWTLTFAARITAMLDDTARRWSVDYTAVCRAGWTEEMHDRGMRCLARTRRELGVVVDVLGRAERGITARADKLVRTISDPDPCMDAAALTGDVPTVPPAADAISAAFDSARATRIAGQPREALRVADALLPITRALAWPSLVARNLIERGTAYEDLDRSDEAASDLREAYLLARGQSDPIQAGAAAAALARALLDLSSDARAADWAQLAQVEAEARADPASLALALDARTLVARDQGDHPTAAKLVDEELTLVRRMNAPERIALVLLQRAQVRHAAGQERDALADLSDVERQMTELYGPAHPLLITVSTTRGLIYDRMGDHAASLAAAERAVRLAGELYTSDDPASMVPINVLGIAYMDAGRNGDALPLLDRSIALARKIANGAPSFNVAEGLNDRALDLVDLERTDEAVTAWNEACPMFEVVLGPRHEQSALCYANLADALLHARRLPDAALAVAAAKRTWPSSGGDDVKLAFVLTASGMSLAASDPKAAQAELERALAIRSAPDANLDDRAYTELQLAKLFAARGVRVRARELAYDAELHYRTAGNAEGAGEASRLR